MPNLGRFGDDTNCVSSLRVNVCSGEYANKFDKSTTLSDFDDDALDVVGCNHCGVFNFKTPDFFMFFREILTGASSSESIISGMGCISPIVPWPIRKKKQEIDQQRVLKHLHLSFLRFASS